MGRLFVVSYYPRQVGGNSLLSLLGKVARRAKRVFHVISNEVRNLNTSFRPTEASIVD